MKIDIKWEQPDLRRDGSIRPYSRKASTIHGWVTKLRGTLFDDEAVRRRGIREMRDAKAIRKWKTKRTAERRARGQSGGRGGSSGGGFLSLLGLGPKKKPSRHSSTSKPNLVRGTSSRSTTKVSYRDHSSNRPPKRSGTTKGRSGGNSQRRKPSGKDALAAKVDTRKRTHRR